MVGYDLPEISSEELRKEFLEYKWIFRNAVDDTRAIQEQIDILLEDYQSIARTSLSLATIAINLLRELD